MKPMTGKSDTIITFPQPHRQELLFRCSACGADRGCDCNAPAIEKIAEALSANPKGSTRAIAKAAGVSQSAAQRAMKPPEPSGSGASDDAPDAKRLGRDGKSYPATRAHRVQDSWKSQDNPPDDASWSPPTTPEEKEKAFRDLIMECLVDGLDFLAMGRGSKLTDDYLREVFEEFLCRRHRAITNLNGVL